MQRPAIVPASNVFFRRLRLCQSNLRGKPRVSVQSLAKLLATLELKLRELHGRDLFRLDPLGQLRNRQVKEFLGGHPPFPSEFFRGARCGRGYSRSRFCGAGL